MLHRTVNKKGNRNFDFGLVHDKKLQPLISITATEMNKNKEGRVEQGKLSEINWIQPMEVNCM